MTITTPVTIDSVTAREAGFLVPVVITREAWESAIAWTDADTTETGMPQDETGRLWDVLYLAAIAVRRAQRTPGAICEAFTVERIPRGVRYPGDDEPDPRYLAAMVEPLTVIVGGTPTTVTISLDKE